MSVELTGSGTLKGRLYVHLDLSNTSSPIQLLTERASTLTPPVQDADVNISNGVYEFNVAEFTVGTATISDLADVSPQFGAISKTLTAGQTQVTFDHLPTFGNWLMDFYASNGINYSEIDSSVPGQVTLTYDEQEENVTVYYEIKEV